MWFSFHRLLDYAFIIPYRLMTKFGHRSITSLKNSNVELWCLNLNHLVNRQSSYWWLATSWRSFGVTVMNSQYIVVKYHISERTSMLFCFRCDYITISMAKCKTVVTTMLTNWSYCSLALSHRRLVGAWHVFAHIIQSCFSVNDVTQEFVGKFK